MTKQRRLILEIIAQSKDHLTAEEIFLKARATMPSIAVGTVYRNLNVLCDQGFIGRISVINQPDRFDSKPDRHHHLICSRCGKIEDAPFGGIESYLQSQTEREITGYELNVFHLCEACRKAEQLENPENNLTEQKTDDIK